MTNIREPRHPEDLTSEIREAIKQNSKKKEEEEYERRLKQQEELQANALQVRGKAGPNEASDRGEKRARPSTILT